MKTVIRVDAANHMGYGHAMRCLSLADGLRRWNNEPIFICRELSGNIIAMLRSREYTVHSFVEGNDAEQTLKILNKLTPVDILIVDHYGLDKVWQQNVRHAVSQLVVLDDLANRPHLSDWLIDPSFGRQASDYKDLVPADCQLLLGSSYVLLSEPYSHLRYSTLARREKTQSINRLLISMGGTDPANATTLIIESLMHVKKSLLIDVVVRSQWSQLNSIKEKINASHHTIKLHIDIINLAGLMSAADLAIGAGGTTTYERCCLGLPTILLVIADNQLYNARVLQQHNAVIFLGRAEVLTIDVIAEAINELIHNPLQWQRMSKAAATVCDGYGVNRVVSQLLSDNNALSLRPATFADSAIMFKWQQQPSTRQYARNSDIPSQQQHEQWVKQRLANPNCLFNVMVIDREPVGVLRFDRFIDQDNAFEISILVAPEHRNKGIAASALKLSRQLFPNLDFYAEVHPDNKASHQLFTSAGYVFEEKRYFNPRINL